MIPFHDFWDRLIPQLREIQTIPNWTKDGKMRTEDFQAQYKGGNYIECAIDDGSIISVPKKDFHYIYYRWDDYMTDRIKRNNLRDESRYTKYVISIIHNFIHLTYD